jgi:hypothetical protein
MDAAPTPNAFNLAVASVGRRRRGRRADIVSQDCPLVSTLVRMLYCAVNLRSEYIQNIGSETSPITTEAQL